MDHLLCPSCQQMIPLTPAARPPSVCPLCGCTLKSTTDVPAWVRNGVDLRIVARRQRLLLWFTLGILLLYLVALAADNSYLRIPIGIAVLLLALLSLAAVVGMLDALRVNGGVQIVIGLLLLVPCLNILLLAIANHMACEALRKAGLRVHFMGVRDEELVRVLDIYRCRGCGYSLVGNTSGICSECGRPTGLLAPPGADKPT